MSRSPGEGTTRHDKDHYITPRGVIVPLIEELLPLLQGRGAGRGIRVLDPGAGTGIITRVVRELLPAAHITAVEVDRTYEDVLRTMSGADEVVISDYLRYGSQQMRYVTAIAGEPVPQPGIDYEMIEPFDLIVGNPPFSWWQRFAAHSFNLRAPGGIVSLLGNMHVLESTTRGPWWQENENDAQRVIYPRPSFTAGPTDAIPYAWILWASPELHALRPFGHYHVPKPTRARAAREGEAAAK